MKALLNISHFNGHTEGFHPHVENEHHLVQPSKQYHMKVLLNSSRLNGDTLGFHLKT